MNIVLTFTTHHGTDGHHYATARASVLVSGHTITVAEAEWNADSQEAARIGVCEELRRDLAYNLDERIACLAALDSEMARMEEQ